jgi:hypothetical protein
MIAHRRKSINLFYAKYFIRSGFMAETFAMLHVFGKLVVGIINPSYINNFQTCFEFESN